LQVFSGTAKITPLLERREWRIIILDLSLTHTPKEVGY